MLPSWENKVKVTEIAVVLRRAATEMQAFAVNNDDLDLPNELILPFIINFLTDKRLRKLSATRQSHGFKSPRRATSSSSANNEFVRHFAHVEFLPK